MDVNGKRCCDKCAAPYVPGGIACWDENCGWHHGVCVATAYGEPWCVGKCIEPRNCTATPRSSVGAKMGNMSDDTSNPFDPKNLALPSDLWALTPAKIKKRRQHFAMLPMTWYERLKGADGQTYRVAWFLLYQHWKNNGDPIKLANGMLAMDGVPSESKRRALRDLERRGLITVERWPKKSPVVRLMA